MSLASSLDPLQPPHRLDWSLPEPHDQPDSHYDGGEVSTPSTSQQTLPDAAGPACPRSPRPPDSPTHTGSGLPGWKRLIISPLVTHERISLITTIFSSRDKVEAIKHLSREDAQIFVDEVCEARSYILSSQRINPLNLT